MDTPKKEYEQLDVIYKYTEDLIKSKENSIDRIDTKLSTFIGFSGILVRLVLDLPSNSRLTSGIKILICILVGFTVMVASWGLRGKSYGTVASAKYLMSDDLFFREKEKHQSYIINSWIEVIDEYTKILKNKRNELNIAIVTFGTAIILYGISIAIQ